MDFQLSEQQRELQAAARKFARAEMPAVADMCEETGHPPGREMLNQLGEMGFWVSIFPKVSAAWDLAILRRFWCWRSLPKYHPLPPFRCLRPMSARCMHCSFRVRSLAAKNCARGCRGNMVLAVSMSEPQAGSALTDLTTRGLVADGKVVLNGQKRWCSGGGHSDGYLIYTRLSDDPGAKGIGAVFVENGTPGLSFGAQEDLMGFRGVPSADIFLDDVSVPEKILSCPRAGSAN